MSTVFILHGRNAVDLADRVAGISTDVDPSGLSTSQIDIATTDEGEIRAAVSTPAFFGAGRYVEIRGIPGIDKPAQLQWESLVELLSELQPSTVVVLRTGQKIPGNRRILKDAVSNGWKVELFDLLYGSDLVSWVERRVSRTGHAIDRSAARQMLSRLFPGVWQREDRWTTQTIDMWLLATEIEKLTSGALNVEISESMIRDLIADRTGVTAFKLNDETFAGRVNAALTELDAVLAMGDAPERVIGQVGYQPAVLVAVGLVERYGVDAVSAAAGMSAGQLKATIARKTAWRHPEKVAAATESLRRAEWLVKTGRTPSTISALVPLVAEIASIFDER